MDGNRRGGAGRGRKKSIANLVYHFEGMVGLKRGGNAVHNGLANEGRLEWAKRREPL